MVTAKEEFLLLCESMGGKLINWNFASKDSDVRVLFFLIFALSDGKLLVNFVV
jgi:hypothetical protein